MVATATAAISCGSTAGPSVALPNRIIPPDELPVSSCVGPRPGTAVATSSSPSVRLPTGEPGAYFQLDEPSYSGGFATLQVTIAEELEPSICIGGDPYPPHQPKPQTCAFRTSGSPPVVRIGLFPERSTQRYEVQPAKVLGSASDRWLQLAAVQLGAPSTEVKLEYNPIAFFAPTAVAAPWTAPCAAAHATFGARIAGSLPVNVRYARQLLVARRTGARTARRSNALLTPANRQGHTIAGTRLLEISSGYDELHYRANATVEIAAMIEYSRAPGENDFPRSASPRRRR
jgi:hypothetical protein